MKLGTLSGVTLTILRWVLLCLTLHTVWNTTQKPIVVNMVNSFTITVPSPLGSRSLYTLCNPFLVKLSTPIKTPPTYLKPQWLHISTLSPLIIWNVLTTNLRGPPLSCTEPTSSFPAIRSCLAMSPLWTTESPVQAMILHGQAPKLYPMSLTLTCRPMPFETTWPQHFRLVRLIQRVHVEWLYRNTVSRTPSLTVSPLGEREKNSLRKCSIRLSVLMGWPRLKLRERVSTSDPFLLSMQTPLCRVLVKSQVPYMENFMSRAYM